jgi:hypothetical protein
MPRACNTIVISLCLCVCSLSLGCSPGIINKSVSQHQELGFLQIGKTPEQETIGRMGEPNYMFEGGKVWVYRLYQDARHRLYFPNETFRVEEGLSLDPGTQYLVLVFDENGILARHSFLYYSPR